MKQSLFAATAALVFAGSSALAADLPIRAPAYKAPPAYFGWTGCYIGANVGGVWARLRDNWTPNPAGFPVSGPSLTANGTATLHDRGFTGGGQIGCNYETHHRIVWGVEGDFNFTDVRGIRDVAVPASGPVAAYSIHEEFRARWLSTIRGRVGFTADRTLFYATGGVAFANLKTLDSAVFPASATNNTVSGSGTRTGWTVGGGIERALTGAWSIKAEYLFARFGHFSRTSANSDPGTFPLSTIVHDHRLEEHIARIGLNYRFGGMGYYY
jgi:outer membrane immunogenic protein